MDISKMKENETLRKMKATRKQASMKESKKESRN